MLKSKKSFLQYLFVGCFAIFILSSYSGGYDGDLTGSPLSGGTCAASANGCHGGGTPGGSVTLMNAPTSYIHNTTYTMNLKVADSDMQRAGFQITAVDNAGNYIGEFIENLPTIREASGLTGPTGEIQGLTHGSPQTPISGATNWVIQWTAPSSGNASVKFYYVGNAATGGGTGGDFIYTGSSAAFIPLPVRLARFDAKTISDVPTLTWTTASEINTSHFAVERKEGGSEFVEIAQQKAEGFGVASQTYIFEDKTNPVQSKIAYYRLKMVDNDGKAEYSTIKSVRTDTKNTIAIYPTLLTAGLTNTLFVENVGKSDENVGIFDINGRLIQQNILQKGKNNIDISLQKGTYFVKIGDFTRKIVVLD